MITTITDNRTPHLRLGDAQRFVARRGKVRATPAAQRGAALITVLLLSAAGLALGLLAANSARTELRIAHNDVLDLQALNVAEAGLNAGLKRIGNHYVLNDELANNGAGICTAYVGINPVFGNGVGNAASGLAGIGVTKTLTSDGLCYRFAAFGGSATDGYYVRTEDNYDETVGGDAPLVDLDGTIRLIVHGVVGTAERIIVGNVSLIGWGLFGINGVTLSGGSCADGGGPCATPLGSSRVGSNGTIALSGGSTKIVGSAVAGATVTTSGGSTVTGTTSNNAPAVSFTAVPACGPPYSANTGITPAGSYNAATGVLNQSSGTVTLTPGTYCFSTVTLSGGSTTLAICNPILPCTPLSGPVIINMTGTWVSSGGSTVSNLTNDANNLQVNSSATTSLTISGGGQAYMNVYAPAADLIFSGNSNFYGSFIAKTATASGGSQIHQNGVTGAKLSSWHEVQN